MSENAPACRKKKRRLQRSSKSERFLQRVFIRARACTLIQQVPADNTKLEVVPKSVNERVVFTDYTIYKDVRCTFEDLLKLVRCVHFGFGMFRVSTLHIHFVTVCLCVCVYCEALWSGY